MRFTMPQFCLFHGLEHRKNYTLTFVERKTTQTDALCTSCIEYTCDIKIGLINRFLVTTSGILAIHFVTVTDSPPECY
jgi:hypothetical protein